MTDANHSTSNSSFTATEKSAIQNNQTIKRAPHNKENKYVVISKAMLMDKKLSPRTKGVFCYLLCQKDDYIVHPRHLAKELGVGKDQVYAALTQMIEQGYATRTILVDQHGKVVGSTTEFSEEKSTLSGNPPVKTEIKEKSTLSGNPDTENQTLVSNKYSPSTESSNSVCSRKPKPKPAKEPAAAPSSLRCGTQSFYKTFSHPHLAEAGYDPKKFEIGLTESNWHTLLKEYSEEKIIRCAHALSSKFATDPAYRRKNTSPYMALRKFLENEDKYQKNSSFQKPVTHTFVATGNKGDESFFPKSMLEMD